MSCDRNIERYARKKYYEILNGLMPAKRFAKKFKIETEELQIEIKETDEIVGWFHFDKQCWDEVIFDDEIQSSDVNEIIYAPNKFSTTTNVDRGHTLVDYESILKNGLIFYQKQLDEEFKKHPEDEYLLSMRETLSAVFAFVGRIIDTIDEKIINSCGSQKNRLLALKSMIKKVPYYPAETFCEAVQSVWIIHFLLPLAENAWYSISLGKFAEYMHPFYKQSLNNGMTRDDAKKILHNLYELLNSYADGACVLNIGPNFNDLSELIIECQKDFAMPSPILAVRIDEETPNNIWDLLIDEKLFSMGQPTFYGEKSCINALIEKGVTIEEAKGFSNNSCMGISIPGNEFNSMWGCVFSVSAVLETAMNCGKMLKSDDVLVPNIKTPYSIDDLFVNFEKCAKHLLKICVKSYEKRAEISEKNFPDPFVSLLTPSCIEKCCDRISGVKYHNVTFECMGMVNVSDGIYAVDKLIFKDKKYTVEEINLAVKNNFINYETLRNDIIKCSKFGENSEADEYAIRVAQILQRLIREFDHDNIYYSPSLHTLDANVGYGASYGAGYDGRCAGEPFAKNAGASNGVRKPDPTSMILSVTKLPQTAFYGGQPIDITFDTRIVRNHKDKIKALIKVYLDNGGLQFQVNSVSSKLLRDATDNPSKYPNLVVRIGGYSLYFNSLSRESKEEFIDRFEREGV